MVKNNKLSRLMTKMNLRTILKSKLQFVAVIFITAIAMTLYVGLTSNAKSIQNRVNELYQESNMADIWVTTSNFDGNDYYEIKDLVGINGKVESRFALPAKLQSYSATALLSEELPTICAPANTDNTAEKDFFIIDSALLKNRSSNSTIEWVDENGNYLKQEVQVAISSYISSLNEIIIGEFDGKQRTILDVFDACLIKGQENIIRQPYLTLTFQVTGVMDFGENIQSSQINSSSFLLDNDLFISEVLKAYQTCYASPNLDTISPSDPDYELKVFLAKNDLLTLGGIYITSFTQPNQYVAKIDSDYDVDKVRNAIELYFQDKVNNNLLMCNTLETLASNMTVQSDIVQASQLAYIFPIIFFLVAILVVLTTISQIIIKDRIQIGTLKALGISTSIIVLHYMMLAIYIVLIGIVLGIIIGPFVLPFIMNQKYAILYSLPPMQYTIAYVEAIVSTLVVLAMTALVTFSVTFKEAKLLPSEGMRPKQIKKLKTSKRDILANPKVLPFKMAYRNIKLTWSKSLMVVIGVAGCTALLVCGFGIEDTLNNGIDTDIRHFFGADGYVTYSSTESKYEEIMGIEGVTYAEEYTSLPTTIIYQNSSYQTYVNAYVDDSQFVNIGYEIKDKVVVSNKIANALNLKIGDKITFTSLGMTFEGEIGFVLESFYMHGIFLNSAYHNYNLLTDVKTSAWVFISPQANQNEVLSSINDIVGISSVRSKQEGIDLINSYMSSITLMTLAVRVFAILLAVVVLYNLSLLNYYERLRDIATLKVLGFSLLEIAESLIIESMTLTLVGVVVGLFFGLPMEILVLIVNLTPLVEFLYVVYPLSYVLSFILTIGTAFIVNLFLTNKIKKIKMVESLKSIE